MANTTRSNRTNIARANRANNATNNANNTTNNRRGTNNGNSASNIVTYLFGLQVAAKLMHWQTRSYAAHQATGGLFDKIIELTDEIIEQYMGTYGRLRMLPGASVPLPNMTKAAMIQTLRDGITYLNTRLPRDPHIQNLRDELTGEMAKATFLLTLR